MLLLSFISCCMFTPSILGSSCFARCVQTRRAAGPGRSVRSHVDETAEVPRHTYRDAEETSDARQLTPRTFPLPESQFIPYAVGRIYLVSRWKLRCSGRSCLWSDYQACESPAIKLLGLFLVKTSWMCWRCWCQRLLFRVSAAWGPVEEDRWRVLCPRWSCVVFTIKASQTATVSGLFFFFFSVRWYLSFKGKYTGCIASHFSETTSRLSLGLNKHLRSKWNSTTPQFKPEYQLPKPATTCIVLPSWLNPVVSQSVTSLCGRLKVYS